MRDSLREGILQVLSIFVSFRSMHNVFQTQCSIQNQRVETWNEMVSIVSTYELHVTPCGGGGDWSSENITQSAKSCPNLIFLGG